MNKFPGQLPGVINDIASLVPVGGKRDLGNRITEFRDSAFLLTLLPEPGEDRGAEEINLIPDVVHIIFPPHGESLAAEQPRQTVTHRGTPPMAHVERTGGIGADVLENEPLTLPDRPDGYDELCRMVMRGELADAARIAHTGDTFWRGVETWAEAHDLRIEQELDALLERETEEKEE